MTILVTGGAGYIGSHTCVELLNAGYNIVVLDNYCNSSPVSLSRVMEITGKEFKAYYVDMLDKDGLRKVFLENNIEAVIHFAGLKAVGESVSVPLKYYQNNISGTVTLCEVMQEFNVKKLVFSSSATVYGMTDKMPLLEKNGLGAINPYGRTKQMLEEMLRDIAYSDYEWSIAILRYFNPIGAHKSGKIGEDPNGIPNNLMPFIAQVAVGKRQQLQVFGSDYPTKDGTGVRDYIHVVDLAVGHIKALERINQTNGVDAYNLGTGKGYSVIDVVTAFEKVSGKKIPYTFASRRPGDISICYADPTKSKVLMNWEATRDIEKMCEDTWRWQRQNPNGYEKPFKVNRQNQINPVQRVADFSYALEKEVVGDG